MPAWLNFLSAALPSNYAKCQLAQQRTRECVLHYIRKMLTLVASLVSVMIAVDVSRQGLRNVVVCQVWKSCSVGCQPRNNNV